MTRPTLAVVKVGGSLFDWPDLPFRLPAYLGARRAIDPTERTVLIAGGGPAADWIRALDQVHHLGDEAADGLALHALDLTAVVLAKLIPGSIVYAHLEMLPASWDSRSIHILAPRQLLLEIDRGSRDPLPATWEVTSDAIAARIAAFLEASSLVLLKSAPLPQDATREDAARLELVDPVFPSVARSLPRVEYVNLRTDPLDCRLLLP
jgi:5-(aminomethyl)-3-furanmethanol phosphate kinase